MNSETLYNTLVSIRSLEGVDSENALDRIASLVDLSFALRKPDGLRHSIKLCAELQEQNLSDKQTGLLHYFWANAYSHIKNLTKKGTVRAWDWEQEEVEKEIFHLRTALKFGERKLSKEYLCRVYTNLGNVMSNIGRIEDAFEYWDKVLKNSPSFFMALGNRGYGRYYYARLLNDQDAVLFLQYAHNDLTQALLSKDLSPEAKKGFANSKKEVDSVLSKMAIRSDDDPNSFSLGDSKEEVRYRKWCLSNRLYLNPRNSLGSFSGFAHDSLHIPSIVTKFDEGPCCMGFFSQMKQEFVSARYLYFDAMISKEPHFSDKEVLLADTFDYSAYSLAVEKLKVSFRAVYSIFDKIAFFLNFYMLLSIPEKRISFSTIWYESQSRRNELRKDFQQRQNAPLRGLFWLSKDLYEDKPGFKESIDPDAKEIKEIRNHLEHKYLKIYTEAGPVKGKGAADTLAFSIHRIPFERKTLKLIKMVRVALIYLSLAIRLEERVKAKGRRGNNQAVSMPLDNVNDAWKT